MSNKNLELVLNELQSRRLEIQESLKGLSHVPVFGWTNPLNLLLRRRESYILGELRALILAIDLIESKMK